LRFEAKHVEFPKRVYTEEDVQRAKEAIEKGYKHQLIIKGSPAFKEKLNEALRLIKLAGYYDFLRTYIRQIEEIDGFSQLHEADAALWATMPMLEDAVDAASYIVQKAQQMKDYVEGKLYYGVGEMASIEKRIEFLEKLKEQSKDDKIKERCEELLKRWADSTFMFP
jgi:hydroxymethylpyrimidine/phosphomethylpyrimidine kinase